MAVIKDQAKKLITRPSVLMPQRREFLFSAAASSLLIRSASAAAPRPGSKAAEDMNEMGPYFKNLKQPDHPTASCCSDADCRMLGDGWKFNDSADLIARFGKAKIEQLSDLEKKRVAEDQYAYPYKAFISEVDAEDRGWQKGPNAWLRVPREKIMPNPRHPQAYACWSANKGILDFGFYCFNPGVNG